MVEFQVEEDEWRPAVVIKLTEAFDVRDQSDGKIKLRVKGRREPVEVVVNSSRIRLPKTAGAHVHAIEKAGSSKKDDEEDSL